MRLNGKQVLLTGASKGIGRAIALLFADEGADLALTARNADALNEVAEAVRAKGRRAHPLVWDVRDVGRVDERLAEARAALGGLDIVVNNEACKNAKREDIVRVAAGNSKVGMDFIKAGTLHAITYQSAEADGALPLKLAADWFNGKQLTRSVYYLPKKVIARENVDQFMPAQW